ncbi:MAG: cytochrome c [Alphaproteobacteria bacterium]|nr:cytochrome c [Alphaproteobacteria bacterium]
MPEDKSVINVGSKVYAVNCASCHGIKLEGQKDWMSRLPNGMMPAPPHDKTGHTWHHSDKYLFMITKYGIEKIIGEKYLNNMPAYEEILSDKEIIAVLSYIKSTWPPRIKKIHDQINSRSNK